MAHTSNQAVASQDQAAPSPQEDPPRRRRHLIGWLTALTALGVSTALLGGGLWFTRFSIAELLIGAALSERGADADFEVVALDFEHAVLHGVRFGAENAPDAAIASIEARWGWRGLVPELRAVRVIEPRLRLRLDGQGRVSAGALDRIESQPSARRMALPAIRLDIIDGQALIEAPFGAVTATFRSEGVLGEDFTALAQIPETTRPGESYALTRGAAELAVNSQDGALGLRFFANAASIRWGGVALDDAGLRIVGRAPLDLSRLAAEGAWRAASLEAPQIQARNLLGVMGAEAATREDALAPQTWSAQAGASAGALTLADNTLNNARFNARAEGGETQGAGEWSLAANRFAGLAMTSAAPGAGGAFTLDWREQLVVDANARVLLAQTQLMRAPAAHPRRPARSAASADRPARRGGGRADRAADRFDLAIPLRLRSDRAGARFCLKRRPWARGERRALSLAPLREDRPALQLDWPRSRCKARRRSSLRAAALRTFVAAGYAGLGAGRPARRGRHADARAMARKRRRGR